MNRQNLSAYYAANVRLVHKVAQRAFVRLKAIGASLDYDDLVQELSEVFIKSYDQYDETRLTKEGKTTKFSTYYISSAFNQVNKLAKRYELERCELGMRSIEEIDSGNEQLSALEMIDSGYPTPEQYVEAAEIARSAVSGLSPMATTIAEMLIDPPAFLDREVEAAIAHGVYARSKNVSRRARRQVGISVVCSVIEKVTNAPHSVVAGARRELEMAFEVFADE